MIETLAVLLVVFVGVFTQSLAGFGSALVAMALLPGLIGVQAATPLVAILALTTEVSLLYHYRLALNLSAIRTAAAASIAGIPLGIWALRGIPEGIFLAGLGVVLVGYALYGFLKLKLPALQSAAWGYGFGFLAGLLGGAYNTSGPPIVIYASCRGWAPAEFKSNLQGFFIINSTLVVLSHLLVQNMTPTVWRLYLWSLPVLALGILLGTRLDARIPHETFRKLVLGLLLLMGLRLVIQAFTG
ncbi:MAG: sulfite exporter TauE/SafE family protein [Chloroflexota bacterium]|nr:MAG: sulfite exporter TauE/SafE family protein [Chloroflexota bacterium]